MLRRAVKNPHPWAAQLNQPNPHTADSAKSMGEFCQHSYWLSERWETYADKRGPPAGIGRVFTEAVKCFKCRPTPCYNSGCINLNRWELLRIHIIDEKARMWPRTVILSLFAYIIVILPNRSKVCRTGLLLFLHPFPSKICIKDIFRITPSLKQITCAEKM